MSRGLGAPLALSLLAHGGAVATVAVLGTAWLGGSSPLPAPPALYVDLVHPVVATSERREAAEAPALRRRGGRPRPSIAGAAPPVPADAAWPVDTGRAALAAPTVGSERPPSAPPEVTPPPTAPVVPGSTVTRAESTAGAEAVSPRASPALTVASMPSAAPAALAAPSLPDTVTDGPATDTGSTSPRPFGPRVPARPPSGPADGVSTASSGSVAQRPSRGPGSGEPAGLPAPAQPGQASTAAPDPGGQPAGADGARLARVPSGEAQGSSAPDGAIAPEYESYVRSLRQRVQDRLAYPSSAVRRGQQGVVELEVRVGADGRLVAIEVVAGVSADTLRAAAVAAVRGSAPFPFPPGLTARPLVIRLPVEFRLR